MKPNSLRQAMYFRRPISMSCPATKPRSVRRLTSMGPRPYFGGRFRFDIGTGAGEGHGGADALHGVDHLSDADLATPADVVDLVLEGWRVEDGGDGGSGVEDVCEVAVGGVAGEVDGFAAHGFARPLVDLRHDSAVAGDALHGAVGGGEADAGGLESVEFAVAFGEHFAGVLGDVVEVDGKEVHVLAEGFVGESLAGVDSAGADVDESVNLELAGEVEEVEGASGVYVNNAMAVVLFHVGAGAGVDGGVDDFVDIPAFNGFHKSLPIEDVA